MTLDLRGAEYKSAGPGPGRTRSNRERCEGGQSQDTITREKRLTGPGGWVTNQKQRTAKDVQESRIQEAVNEEFTKDFEKDGKIVKSS